MADFEEIIETDDDIDELDVDEISADIDAPKSDRKHFDASQIVRKAEDTTSPRSKRYLRWLCEKGLQRFVMPKLQDPDFKHTEQEYRDRLEYELEVIEGMGYVDYFLIVQDYVNYAKNHGIPTGPGRGCLTPECQVWTATGLTELGSVKIGDTVYDMNGLPSKVLNVFNYDVDEELLEIYPHFGDKITMTKDHKVLHESVPYTSEQVFRNSSGIRYEKTKIGSKLEWSPASELAKNDFLVIPKPQVKEIIPNIIDIVDFLPDYLKERVKIDDDFIYHTKTINSGYANSMRDIAKKSNMNRRTIRNIVHEKSTVQPKTIHQLERYLATMGTTLIEWKRHISIKEKERLIKINRRISFDEDLMYIMGYYLADGWTHYGRVGFAFHENDSIYMEKLNTALQNVFGLSLNLIKSKDKHLVCGYIYSEILVRFFKYFVPEKVATKSIPEEWKSYPLPLLEKLIEGLWDGDGHLGDHSFRYTSISRRLIDDVKFILLRFGIPSKVKTREHTKSGQENWHISYTLQCSPNELFEKIYGRKMLQQYLWQNDENNIYVKIRDIKAVAYKGKVVDLSVDTKAEPSYLTEGFVVHNSAAGALVSYLSGITGLDPIPYGLYFERFLNPGRKGMPDIDIDFPQSKRQEIIAHIRGLYGNDRVAQIATFSYMAARGSVRDSARILAFPADFGDKISKMISDKPKAKIADDLVEGTELFGFYHQNPDVKKVVDTAMRIEGLIRQGSIHASALVIAPLDITDKMPLQTPKKSQIAKDAGSGGIDLSSLLVQFDGPTVESLGYLKMDILGLGTLDVIENTLEFIKKTRGIHLTLPEIPFDDVKTFELLSAGDTNGVFQVESSGMKDVLRAIKPTKFEEIGDIIALYRPGPMEYIPAYKAGKEDPSSIKYLVPALKPILEETYGIAVYQESLMEIAKEIGGFTLAEADDLRKAISKKKYDLLMKLEEKFYNGARKNGVKEKVLPQLWKLMEAASGYSFNKSHAFCYAVLSYQTAFLKANYTTEFMAAQMTYKKDDQDSIKEYINDCRRFGISVIPPNVNHSSIDFDVTPKGDISFGLAALKGVGFGPAIEIIESRENFGPFKDLNDFLDRVKINSRVYEILAKSSGLDNLGWTKKALIEEKDRVITFVKNINKKVDYGLQQGFDFGDEIETARVEPLTTEEYEPDVLIEFENEMLGMYLTGHPIEYYELGRRLRSKGLPKSQLRNISELPGLKDRDDVYLFGMVSRLHRFESKKGWMAFVTLTDFGIGDESFFGVDPKMYEFDMVLFTEAYSNWGYKMRENDFLSVHGTMNERRDTGALSLIGEEITFLLKDKELNYQSDPIMRRIVMDVLEEIKQEKLELLPERARERAMADQQRKMEKEKNESVAAAEKVAPKVMTADISEKDITVQTEDAPLPEQTYQPERVKFIVNDGNCITLLKIIKKNPGSSKFLVELNGEIAELNGDVDFPIGVNLTPKVKMALEFAKIPFKEL